MGLLGLRSQPLATLANTRIATNKYIEIAYRAFASRQLNHLKMQRL
jgi:hypothetical protein